MRKIRFLLLIALFALVAACSAARADISSSLRNEFHPYSELGVRVVTDGSLKAITKVTEDPEARILVFQASYGTIDEVGVDVAMQWVRDGHALWFYDSRFAPYFGMKPFALKSEMFKGKLEQGTLGNEKRNGMACAVMATTEHPILIGVGQATVFLPAVDEDVFSAVEVAGDTVPLLQFATSSPALAAVRRDGRGAVIFKPLLWVKSLSGERFQLNLLEYSAGYGVPGWGGEGRSAAEIGPDAEWEEGNPAAFAEHSGNNAAKPGSWEDFEAGSRKKDASYDASQELKPAGVVRDATVTSSVPSTVKISDDSLSTYDKAITGEKLSAKKETVTKRETGKNPFRTDKKNKAEKEQAAEASAEPSVLRDLIYLTDNSVVVGRIDAATLEFMGSSAEHIKTDEVKQIIVGQYGSPDTMITVTGRKEIGVWAVGKYLRVSTDDGRRDISKSEITRIEFNVPQE